ncbi:arginase family protein [Oleiagrimonas sp. MCCC 1A03011]|uniref:arginase family protein n=1 Tax=Oleiagrimonas sp. MCCC 1A03011 TaxID=1926883 RepID=UPI000DC44A2A|nr:arginase family protein [Oleiagrimonas sp. MCCC 1A03011]RAP59460.1 hypothetical protein BTJ49_02010 [Oleiagrimonas sp. MCCC 1A03011]
MHPSVEHTDVSASLVERRWMVTPDLMLESHDDRHVVIIHTATGTRLKVSTGVYNLLARFEKPQTVKEALGTLEDPRLRSGLHVLMERGLLVDPDHVPTVVKPTRKPSPYRFCSVPAYGTASVDVEFTVIGVPYDLGGQVPCREGPLRLREKSLDYTYLVDFDSRHPRGWFDADSGDRILEGARMVDAADLLVEYGETQTELFRRLRTVLGEIVGTRSVPLILGGDRSIAFPVVQYLAQRRSLSLVQLVPESTRHASRGDMVTTQDVGIRTGALQNVVGTLSMGSREHVDVFPSQPGHVEISLDDLRAVGLNAALQSWTKEGDVFLSVDMSVLDVSIPSRGKGLSMQEVRQILLLIGRRHRIVGVGIFGLDSSGREGELRVICGCHIALLAMDAAMHSGRASP